MHTQRTFVDGYCSTLQGLLDWFEVDLGFTECTLNELFIINHTPVTPIECTLNALSILNHTPANYLLDTLHFRGNSRLERVGFALVKILKVSSLQNVINQITDDITLEKLSLGALEALPSSNFSKVSF